MVVIILTPIVLMVGKESQGFFFSNWAVSEQLQGWLWKLGCPGQGLLGWRVIGSVG